MEGATRGHRVRCLWGFYWSSSASELRLVSAFHKRCKDGQVIICCHCVRGGRGLFVLQSRNGGNRLNT